EQAAWADAAVAALRLWDTAARDPRISTDFRAVCAENRDRVYRAIQVVGGAARAYHRECDSTSSSAGLKDLSQLFCSLSRVISRLVVSRGVCDQRQARESRLDG